MGVLPKMHATTSRVLFAARQLRMCSSSHLAATSSHVASNSEATSFVNEHVRHMQTDIMEQLIPQDASGAVESMTDLNLAANLGNMTRYYFQQGGKMLRPTVSLLMASACNSAANRSISPESLVLDSYASSSLVACRNQYKIGMIAEMIHTASLVHDDVIDEANTRRGNASVNAMWGNKMSVLVGDFILARATQILCSIGRPRVISVMASIIEDLVLGEFMQMSACANDENLSERMDAYIEKTYRKTASLFANSCRSVAILADEQNTELHEVAAAYGKSLGIAFQLVDDLLDFVATADDMGKPVAADLKLGLATAPVLFACEQYPELNDMIKRKFSVEGDAEKAREIVVNSRGMEQTRQMIQRYSEEAVRLAGQLPNRNEATERLVELAMAQSSRKS